MRGLPVAAFAVVVCAAGVARAEHKVLVPRADSSADWGTRKNVERAVLDLARHVDRGAANLDVPFGELADNTGCKGGVAKCKNAVIEAIGIDEVVVITIAPAGADRVKVTVQRAQRGGDIAAATVVVPTDDPGAHVRVQMASLFGLSKREAAKLPRAPAPPAGTMKLGDAEHETPEAARAKAALEARGSEPREEPAPPPREEPRAEPVVEERRPAEPPPPPMVTAAPEQVIAPDDAAPGPVDRPAGSRRKLYLGGLVAGGVLVLGGSVLWIQAARVNSDLDGAPNRTRADVDRLLELEERGDRYALWGNVTVVAGVVVAGASGFLLWRDRRRESAVAIHPTLVPGGAGVAITLGADR
jgi:hypothetical protein